MEKVDNHCAFACWVRGGERNLEAGCQKEIEGASASSAGHARLVVAWAILGAQEDGIAELERTAQGNPCLLFIRNVMFDESSFDLRAGDEPDSVHSILCSHGQWTFAFSSGSCLPPDCPWKAGKTYDEDLCRPPQSMEAMNSQTMWMALATGQGGLEPLMVASKWTATRTTCDAHAANQRLLRHLEDSLPQHHLLLTILCAQHRAGNVVEQLTKLLGNLGGCFCISKVMNKRGCLASLRRQVSKVLSDRLVVWQSLPAGLQDEWAEGSRCARKLVTLCSAFLDEVDEDEGHGEGRRRKSLQQLLAFFNSPWTGLLFGVGNLPLSSAFLSGVDIGLDC